MSYLRVVPREPEFADAPEPAARPVAVVAPRGPDVVYVEDAASAASVTEALQAWGFRVRAEREHDHSRTRGLESETAWTTTRSNSPPMSRLLNILSPVWLPTLQRDTAGGGTPGPAFSWFQRAA